MLWSFAAAQTQARTPGLVLRSGRFTLSLECGHPGSKDHAMLDTLVIATGNPHKIAEMSAMLDGMGLAVIGLDRVETERGLTEPVESGTTFEANARIKALSYSGQTGLACLADDSGLVVDALGGGPGVISSHYATDGRETGLKRSERDSANNERLMGELQGVPLQERRARFVCVMALALPGSGDAPPRVAAITRGSFEGRIGLPSEVPRGDRGFGYDPLFLVDERTSAELSPDQKNALSHRGRAARAMVEIVRGVLGGGAWPIAPG